MIVRKRKVLIIKQEKVEKVSAVLCSDLHIRADAPLCRTDDFQAAMFEKLDFIFNLCRQYDVPLLCGGDIGHRSQWPNWLLERFMALAEGVKIISALGQHDLPGHNLNELSRSACGVFQRAKVVNFENGVVDDKYIMTCHFDEGLPKIHDDGRKSKLPMVLLTHRMVIDGKQDWPGQQTEQAMSLLNQLSFCQLVLTGDNHIPFVVQAKDKRLLVNPGSMMRMTAGQLNHRPRVYLWDAVASQVSPVYLPVAKGVIDRNYIEAESLRDERMRAFTDRIKIDYRAGVDYIDDLHRYFENNRTWDKAQQRVWEACEMEGVR